MRRNDGVLYSGMNGNPRRLAENRARRNAAKREKQAKLSPSAELVMDLLNSEIEETKLAILSCVAPATPETDVRASLAALNLYDQSCKNLKGKLKNILRQPKSDAEVDEEADGETEDE